MPSIEYMGRHISGDAMVGVGLNSPYLTPCYGKHYCRYRFDPPPHLVGVAPVAPGHPL